MVVTRKHDGSPRRTVDLSPLNKYCERETFATESPFQAARRIPPHTWKTTSDAWNGFNSVPLRESDKHLTTFITQYGRMRNRSTPQGFAGSQDGYNRRFDEILVDMLRKERIVDDTCHYDSDTDLEEHWWRTIKFLIHVGRSGIILNPDKFCFARKTVDFAGFRISDTTIEPLPKYLDAIRKFPTPTSTTDIRSWFGLVNQVSNYAQLRNIMAPFRPFLSPKCTFQWTPELDIAFQSSKDSIIQAIRHGVEIFDPTKRTCLRPDWSRQGIGYFLFQKHCTCQSTLPDCCTDGWGIVLAGSRFLKPEEQRYAPIEGEALAVAWGLEQTKYFTQGCNDLLVVTDHKPLVKILGDRTLDEISNPRIFRLKQRTMPWVFEIAHLPGKANAAADATSRHPSGEDGEAIIASTHHTHYTDVVDLVPEGDEVEMMVASIRHRITNFTSLTWEKIASETSKDPTMSCLTQAIMEGFPNDHRATDTAVSAYWPYREYLAVVDGVVVYSERAVIPHSLRESVLDILHCGHQGVSAMASRARTLVFWPGMTRDIQSTRDSCGSCNKNAPSQAATPSIPSSVPSTPFESIFADFFEFRGCHYLLAGDRLSGWVEVFKAPHGTSLAGATGLIAALRTLFATFGVPEELSSDGGPEFTATATTTFLGKWGVQHRVSSAHFPQSNGRAEVAVKKCKRLLMDNIGSTGSLDNDNFLRALLQVRNTPDPDCNISPAEVIFGKPLRDAFSFVNRLTKFNNPSIRPTWHEAWKIKEEATRVRYTRMSESLNGHTRSLPNLLVGDRVFIQNQYGSHPTKWDKSGTVMEVGDHDQYTVKVDGSGRLTLRNRRFLRKFVPPATTIQNNVGLQYPPYHPQSQLSSGHSDVMKAANSAPTPTTLTPPATLASPPRVLVSSEEDSVVPPSPVLPPSPSRCQTTPTEHVSLLPGSTTEQSSKPLLSSPTPPAPDSIATSRPRRQMCQPKMYVPETGQWQTIGR